MIKTNSTQIRNFFKWNQTRAGKAAVRRGKHVPGDWELLDRYNKPFKTLANWFQTHGWDATTQGAFGKSVRDLARVEYRQSKVDRTDNITGKLYDPKVTDKSQRESNALKTIKRDYSDMLVSGNLMEPHVFLQQSYDKNHPSFKKVLPIMIEGGFVDLKTQYKLAGEMFVPAVKKELEEMTLWNHA